MCYNNYNKEKEVIKMTTVEMIATMKELYKDEPKIGKRFEKFVQTNRHYTHKQIEALVQLHIDKKMD